MISFDKKHTKIACFILFIIVFIVGCKQEFSNWDDISITPGNRLKIECDDGRKYTSNEVDGLPILVLCRSREDLVNLQLLNNEVFELDSKNNSESNFRAVQKEIFVVFPISPYSRCEVDFVPIDSVLFEDHSEWLGGFHSICDSDVYDMAGRQLKPGKFNPSGFPKFIGNLKVPKYKFISKDEIEFL